MGYIYKITNIVNNKCYIGETIQVPDRRWYNHKTSIKNNKGCPLLSKAFKKYGESKFKFEVLIICFDEDRFIYEKEYIKKLNSLTPNGYNATEGGEPGGHFKGKTHTNNTKMILKEKATLWVNNVINKTKLIHLIRNGLEKSEKWKKAKEEKRVGTHVNNLIKKPKTDETKNKISNSLKKYYHQNPNVNKIHNIIGRKGRKVYQFTNNNELINTFNSIKEAADNTNISNRNIHSNVSGRSKTAGGYIWKYADV